MTRKEHESAMVQECIVTVGITCGYCSCDETGYGANKSGFAIALYNHGWRLVGGQIACPSCAAKEEQR